MSTWWNSPKETQGFWSEQVLDLMTLKWTPQTSSCSQLTLSCIRLQNRWLICQYLRFKEHVKAHINIWNFRFPGGKLRKYVTMIQRSHWATLVLLRAGCFPEAEPALYTYLQFPYSQLLWLQLTSSVYPTGLTSEFTTFGSPKVSLCFLEAMIQSPVPIFDARKIFLLIPVKCSCRLPQTPLAHKAFTTTLIFFFLVTFQ